MNANIAATEFERYRGSPREIERQKSLMVLAGTGESALDIGALDGHYSKLLLKQYLRVTALDLVRPDIPGCENVAGDATRLQFADRSFDLVFCAEVLEHIPDVAAACREIGRVARSRVLIGVPYRQDIRLGRMTCRKCGAINPPWGHVNSFDEDRLASLFKGWRVERLERIGMQSWHSTTALAARFMDFAGNPWGTYDYKNQGCLKCGAPNEAPSNRSLPQKAAGRIAGLMNRATNALKGPRPEWMHVVFVR